ncbi:hypothetical protein LSAT2_008603 [Lamellibrachia satsuma]|nr:hypothetical protein LSAT2_008603 [Lamellibrachia satsuma]
MSLGTYPHASGPYTVHLTTHASGPYTVHLTTHASGPYTVHLTTHGSGPYIVHLTTHASGPYTVHLTTHASGPYTVHLTTHASGPYTVHLTTHASGPYTGHLTTHASGPYTVHLTTHGSGPYIVHLTTHASGPYTVHLTTHASGPYTVHLTTHASGPYTVHLTTHASGPYTIVGNQQAALLGQACFSKGQAKSTYGTGCFFLTNTGTEALLSEHGLLTTVAFKLGSTEPAYYALEGSVAVAGGAIQWLQNNMAIIKDVSDVESLAASVNDTQGCYFVPAFSGLSCPYWMPEARGIICGLSQFTTKAHIARAALEAVCFQTRDLKCNILSTL